MNQWLQILTFSHSLCNGRMCEILNCTVLLQNNYVTIGTGDDHYPNVYMSLSDDWTTNQVSQLLQKLRTDLHLSFHSFLKEFVAQPNDGVGLIFVTHLISHGFTWKQMILMKRWKHWFRWRSCWICWSWSSWARQTATTTSKQLKILQTSNRFEKNKQASKYLFINIKN